MSRILLCGLGGLVAALCIACNRDSKPVEAAQKQPAQLATPADPARAPATADKQPKSSLTIAYSDWPGWVAWDIAAANGFFREAGLDVNLLWLEYVPSMEAFSQGKADAVCMTNGDALVLSSNGTQSVGILLNDYSNGNDMVVARAGIKSVAELAGKKIAVEVGFVDHLLLLQALKSVGLSEADVEIVNQPTHKTPALLASGAVSAIAAWQPNSGQALAEVPGSTAIFSSANVPGLIYDLLFVRPTSLRERRDDWKKLIEVWFRVVRYIRDPKTRPDAIRIMSARVKLTPEKYERLIDGTFFLDRAGNQTRFAKAQGFGSVFGSSEAVDKFNIDNHIYKDSASIDALLDAKLVRESKAESP
jgi:NitT/TauT family transport system substrate-binding protein